MTGQTGVARLAISTGVKVLPVAHWGAHELLPYGTKKFRPFPRKTMHVIAGEPIDLSKYADQPMTATVLREATNALQIGLEARLLLFRTFDRVVMQHYSQMAETMNALIERDGRTWHEELR